MDEEEWPAWIPPADAEGHGLGPGRVNWTWRSCDCTGEAGGGHNVVRCRVNGCKAGPLYPPEHRA